MPTPDALQMLLKGDQVKPRRGDQKMGPSITWSAPAGRASSPAREGLGQGQAATAKAPWDDPNFKLPGGKVDSADGHDDLRRRQRASTARDLRQLSRRAARSCRASTRACSCRWIAGAGNETALFRQNRCARHGGDGDDPRAVPSPCGELNKGARRPDERAADDRQEDRRSSAPA
jgi:hypothetical protein